MYVCIEYLLIWTRVMRKTIHCVRIVYAYVCMHIYVCTVSMYVLSIFLLNCNNPYALTLCVNLCTVYESIYMYT